MSTPSLCSRGVSWCFVMLRVPVGLAPAGASARVDPDGQPACELCGRRLSRVKHVHRHGPGHACHPRCKGKQQQSAPAAAAAAVPRQPRKRRAESDPGQLQAAPTLTRRVTPPKPAPALKKQRTRQEERIMQQLDETHARRMAAEAAAAHQ